jgi:hypothetical protein
MKPLWQLDPAGLPGWLGPVRALTQKETHLWVGGWLRDRAERALWPKANGTKHLLFAICDHYEPLHGRASLDVGKARVRAWHGRYPEVAKRFTDADGRHPRHSFFFPGEEYDPAFIGMLEDLVAGGFGEVEVHLHHDADTRASVRDKYLATLECLDRHQVLPRVDGQLRWSFIHGNWALANGRRDGRWCGVDDEVELLHELGCYADFTFPSAPDSCQPNVVNKIYYPSSVKSKRCYEQGVLARVGSPAQNRVLLFQGPLALSRRPGKLGVRIESASLDGSDPPTIERAHTWASQEVSVYGRPEWIFVKLHSHGAPEKNAAVMLGDAIVRFHEGLAEHYNDGTKWKLHYVTAREMYNVARAAMDGKEGDPSAWFNYAIPPAPRCAR